MSRAIPAPKFSFQSGAYLIENDADALAAAVHALRRCSNPEAVAALATIDAAYKPTRCDNCGRSRLAMSKRCPACGKVHS